MAGKIEVPTNEISEHEKAAHEVTRLRRKGIHCHLETRVGGVGSHLEVVRDGLSDSSEGSTSGTASRNDG